MSFRFSSRPGTPKLAAAFVAVAAVIAAMAFVAAAGPVPSEPRPSAAPAFKSVHLFDLDGPAEEAKLAAGLAEFNALFVELGHPECRYRLWKISQPGPGQRRYLWESDWTDQKPYDAIHKEGSFLKLVQDRYFGLEALLKNHLYAQYGEVAIGDPAPGSLSDD